MPELEDQVLEQQQEGEVVESTEPAEPAREEPAAKPTIRESLEKGFKETNERDRARDGKFKGKKDSQISTARREGLIGDPDAPVEGESEAAAPEGEGATAKPAAATPPADWPKDAAAQWAAMPPEAQAVVTKRFEETKKGVEALQARYAPLDQALAPHLDAIKAHGQTPAAAVHHLFTWFQALAANPQVAFPALAKSFGHDLARFVPQAQQPAVAAADKAEDGSAQPPAFDPTPYLQPLAEQIQQLHGKLSTYDQRFAEQNEQKTGEVIAGWANGKTHFEDVRQLMGQLIASGAVPLKEGRVDLDGAYNAAIWAHPEVRLKVIAEQEAAKVATAKAEAEKKAAVATRNVGKARTAAVGIAGGAPGAGNLGDKAVPPKKGISVGESLRAAIEQLRA